MSEQTIRVLLLDDEESLRTPLTEYLKNTHGFIIDPAETGSQALCLLEDKQGHYDIALLDEVLKEPPGGLDVLREIKTKYPDVEVILFTAWGRQAGIDALRAGAYRYFAKPFDKDELATTIRFAAEYGQTRREHKIQAAFHQVAAAINSTLDLNEILKRTCQAAVELFGVDHSGLVKFAEDYGFGKVVAEFPDKGALGHVIQVRGVLAEERLVHQKEVLNIPDVAVEHSLGSVRDTLLDLGIQSILIVPVVLQDKVVASFSLDAMGRKRTFYPNEIELCKSLAEQVAIAIKNARLYEEIREGRDYLHSLYQATTEIILSREPKDVLQNIVETACRTTSAWRAAALLVSESERPRVLASYGFEGEVDATSIRREYGISNSVLRSGQPRFIPDTEAEADQINPAMLAQGVKAAACLPLPLTGKNIGVLWIHFRDKHTFSKTEEQALQLYANQSAIAYDNARRMQELDQLRVAAEAMASKESWKDVLHQIARSAKEVLEADYTLIWPYDAERKIFFPEDLVAENIPDDLLEEFRKVEPQAGSTTQRVLQSQDRYVIIEDLDEAPADFPGASTRAFLQELAVKSFMGIRLDVAGETLGILYVDYKHPRGFGAEDRRILEHFANHAALTLKKARLFEQVRRSQDAARAVAKVITQGDLDKTLQATVEGARNVLRCDIATLYTFDEDTQRFVHAKGVGYQDPNNMRSPEEITKKEPSRSVLWKVIELREPYYHLAEDATSDDFLKGRFVETEKIKSGLSIQLRFGGHPVGVMFINYRTSHRFTQNEIQDALQFANQAAVAIHNAQLHDEVRKRAEVMAGLYEAGKAITSTLSLEETLNHIAEQALRVVGAGSVKEKCFTHIALCEGDKLRFVAAWPPEMLAPLREQIEIDLNAQGDHKIGIAGRCIKEAKPQKVDDVHSPEERDYIEAVKETQSQLSVPLKVGSEIIGVVSVEHPRLSAFTDEDVRNLELLAAQAAMAIQNARRYDNLRRQSEHQQAILAASKAISEKITNQGQLLSRILEQAVERIRLAQDSKAVLGVIQLYDEATNELRFERVYPAESSQALVNRLGERRLLDRKKGRIGITGRAVLERKPQCVPDVNADPDYVVFNETTRSELDVPLLERDKVLGVLSLESDREAAFDENDEKALQALAELAVIAIQNARSYEELNKTKEMLAARTALAWTGMVSSTWRHAIEKHAITIREQAQLLRSDLVEPPQAVGDRLRMIERLADQILEKRMTPPLSTEERADSVPINDLIRERTKQLWGREPYTLVSLKPELQLADSATVRASSEWLRRALDILIDNAVEATTGLSEPKIVIRTEQVGSHVEISVIDNGRGISPDIKERLFREPIKKPQGAEGHGIGLLLAQMIVQAYGGSVSCRETKPTGTTMVISLPLEIS